MNKWLLFFILSLHASFSFAEECLEGAVEISNSYATGFKIFNLNEDYLLKVGKHRYLVSKTKECAGILSIKPSVKRVVVSSTSHLAMIEKLREEKSVKGFTDPRLIYSKSFEKVVALGYPMNPEKVSLIRPDVIFSYVTESETLEGVEPLLRLKLPVVFNGDFKENHPLARAEWIKFISVFFGKFEEAQKLFMKIENSYLQTKMLISKKRRIPVLVGKDNHGIWEGPGSSSYLIKLLEDAGGSYLLQDFGKERVILNFEKLLQKSQGAQVWFPQHIWNSKEEISRETSKYGLLSVFKNGAVYNSNRRVNRGGGHDYWESAVINPDLLLRDLVKILHPEVLDHQLIWYKKLQ